MKDKFNTECEILSFKGLTVNKKISDIIGSEQFG